MDPRLPTRRLVAGLAVTTLLAGCGGGATVSPPSTTPTSPGPTASPTPTAAVKVVSVAGTTTCPAADLGSGTTVSDGYQEFRDGTLACTVTASDPRVSGIERGSPWNTNMWGKTDSVAMVQWGALRLENAGGAWEGTGSGVSSSDRGDIVVSWYRGTGGYAGLGYFELRSGKEPYAIRGLVFPGAPPDLAGLPPVTGPLPSPNVSDTPAPVPAATPGAIAYGPVSVVEGTSAYTYVDIGTNTYAGIDQVNDPRVSGTYLAPSWTTNFWGGTSDSFGSGTQWGPTRLEAEGGAWQGTGSGILDEVGDVIAMWYTGSGSYAGLSYFELLGSPNMFDPTIPVDRYGVFGQVFPGDPPTP
jgi:hypothetical protein